MPRRDTPRVRPVLAVLLLLPLASGCGGFGTRMKFKGGELYYTKAVSKDEAQKLGDHLVREGFFTAEPKTVQLDKSGDTYEVRLAIKPEFRDNEDYLRLLGVFGAEISQKVFDKAPVVVHVCDERLKTQREVEPFSSEAHNGGTLYRDASVGKAEAESLGGVLVKEGFFDGAPKTLLLRKGGGTYDLHMVVKPGSDKDPALAGVFKQMCRDISQKAFGGSPVRLHLCNEQLKTLKVVPSGPEGAAP